MVGGAGTQVAGLFFAYDFDHGSFLTPQGDFISHNFIFDRVLKRSIEQHFYCFPLDESHFDDTAAEPSVSQDFDDNPLFSCFQIR